MILIWIWLILIMKMIYINNSKTIIKIYKNYKNKNDYSDDTLYFINNNRFNNSKINVNHYNKSSSFSMLKDMQNNNNNSSITKNNYSNYMNDNKFNITKVTNLENTSIAGQIKYLIKLFLYYFYNLI